MAAQTSSSFLQVDRHQGAGSQQSVSRAHAWLFRGLGFAVLCLIGLTTWFALPSHPAKPADILLDLAFNPALPAVHGTNFARHSQVQGTSGERRMPPVMHTRSPGKWTAFMPYVPHGNKRISPSLSPLRSAQPTIQMSLPTEGTWSVEQPVEIPYVLPDGTWSLDQAAEIPYDPLQQPEQPQEPKGDDSSGTGDPGYIAPYFHISGLSILVVGTGALLATTAGTARQRSSMAAARVHPRGGATLAMLADSNADFSDRKAALIAGLKREYSSFFNPMEMDLYDPQVTFDDPMIGFTGTDKFKANVEMLSGDSAAGRLLFSDCGLLMHSCTEEGERALTTRWTLQFRFKLLPWKPLAQFTGVSKYTLDADARVAAQQDFWDSVNLEPGGGYVSRSKLAGFGDLLRQLAPSGVNSQQASEFELPFELLRRTRDYEVRRYPLFDCAKVEYEQPVDGLGFVGARLGAYINSAKETGADLKPLMPALMSIPTGEWDKACESTTPSTARAVRWPLRVPKLGDTALLSPDAQIAIDTIPSCVIGVRTCSFSEQGEAAAEYMETYMRKQARLLQNTLRRDGLEPGGSGVQEFQHAQFDTPDSPSNRKSEVWVVLDQHLWH